MSLIRSQIRGKLYLEVRGLGFASTADSIAAGYVADTFYFQNEQYGTGQFHGTYIYQPSQTGDERVKPAGDLDPTNGQLSHAGSTNFTNTGNSKAYELVGLISPDELNECIRKGVMRSYFYTLAPVSIWTDADFSAGTGAAYTGTNASVAASATAANNQTGFYSLVVTNSAAGGYALGTAVACTPGEELWHAAICRASGAYTCSYGLYDVTHSTEIGSRITHSSREWQHLWRKDTIPSGCYQIAPILGGSENGAVTVWDALPAHFLNQYEWDLPSWIANDFNLFSLREAYYERQVASGQDLASSRRWGDWTRPSEYDHGSFVPEASPNKLYINDPNGVPERDLWYHGLRPYSDIATMENESDSCSAPEDLLMAAVKYELALLLVERYPGEPEWKIMLQDTNAVLQAQREARPATMKRRRAQVEGRVYTPGGRMASGIW